MTPRRQPARLGVEESHWTTKQVVLNKFGRKDNRKDEWFQTGRLSEPHQLSAVQRSRLGSHSTNNCRKTL